MSPEGRLSGTLASFETSAHLIRTDFANDLKRSRGNQEVALCKSAASTVVGYV
jgi:hypothetical protein